MASAECMGKPLLGFEKHIIFVFIICNVYNFDLCAFVISIIGPIQ